MIRVFFFNDPATTEIYTLSLHDALPIYPGAVPRRARARGDNLQLRARRRPARGDDRRHRRAPGRARAGRLLGRLAAIAADRKSTRLNSSHANISYAVFCLKKKRLLFIKK